MIQYFFASPADITALFQEIEHQLNICYVWGFPVPFLDVLNVYDSCDEIDCFGYAVDSTYWLDIHPRETALALVQNAHGYYFSNERVQLHICNTAIGSRSGWSMKRNELYCPPGAKEEYKSLFRSIKRAMQKKWQKIDGILYGPDVFRERERLLFFGDTTFSFSGDDPYATTWEAWFASLSPERKDTPFLRPPPELTIRFYASSGDMLAFFQQLETQHTSMRYWCGTEDTRFDHVSQLFSKRFQDDNAPKSCHALDL